MDDSKSIDSDLLELKSNGSVRRLIALKRPLNHDGNVVAKPITRFLHYFDINHRGVLVQLDGGEQILIHRLLHNVTLTHVTELNSSWEEGSEYDFCDTITLQQIIDLTDVHKSYSLVSNNCIHTSDKILNWGAERACCKDEPFRTSSVRTTNTVEIKNGGKRYVANESNPTKSSGLPRTRPQPSEEMISSERAYVLKRPLDIVGQRIVCPVCGNPDCPLAFFWAFIFGLI